MQKVHLFNCMVYDHNNKCLIVKISRKLCDLQQTCFFVVAKFMYAWSLFSFLMGGLDFKPYNQNACPFCRQNWPYKKKHLFWGKKLYAGWIYRKLLIWGLQYVTFHDFLVNYGTILFALSKPVSEVVCFSILFIGSIATLQI